MLRINRKTSEETLLLDCQKGKAQAQKELYGLVSGKMLGVCLRYIKDRDEAEHIMIGGMVRVFDKIGQYKNEGSLEGWIRKVMVNECLMYLRKQRVMFVSVEVADNQPALDFATLESELETQDLLALIDTLPPGYRTVFNLYAIEGFGHKEIGEMIGISESTSKSQLSRARNLLQQKLASMQDLELKKREHGTIG
jgi:RNA polymerase sigma factor (sigma-70 family)